MKDNGSRFTHRDPQKAFDEAIASGRLSERQTAWNYAGDYMYMGTFANGGPAADQFKHIDSRRYLPSSR